MLMVLNSYSADFYRFLQFPYDILSLNCKNEVKCWVKIVQGNYYLDLLVIFKRKHIVKMNSVKVVLSMVDNVVENCSIRTWQNGLIQEICL